MSRFRRSKNLLFFATVMLFISSWEHFTKKISVLRIWKWLILHNILTLPGRKWWSYASPLTIQDALEIYKFHSTIVLWNLARLVFHLSPIFWYLSDFHVRSGHWPTMSYEPLYGLKVPWTQLCQCHDLCPKKMKLSENRKPGNLRFLCYDFLFTQITLGQIGKVSSSYVNRDARM